MRDLPAVSGSTRIHLCPGSGTVTSQFQMAPGSETCHVCKRFVPLTNQPPGTRLQPHQRDNDRHTRYADDGVDYCGWATEIGVFDGCGKLWPCGGDAL